MKSIISIILICVFLTSLSFPIYAQQPAYRVESIAQNLSVPWSIVITDENRLLVSERDGTIVQIVRNDSTWQTHTIHTLPDVEQHAEAGLMGLALDPAYASNRLVYAMYAYESAGNLFARVIRFTDQQSTISNQQTIIDALPCAQYHCGGGIAFGPDDMLYISIGDARKPQEAQNTESLNGSILRVNSDGSIPADNPFGNEIWSYGHRNVQGFSWTPESGSMFASEHGPSGIDGFGGGDEINLIEKGTNYGWPTVSHREINTRFASPAWLFAPDGPPAFAPASAHIIQNPDHPWYGDLLIGALYEGDLITCTITGSTITACSNIGLSYGRIRAIAESPDGTIFFSTSNTDGRSTVSGSVSQESDDHIYALIVESDSTVRMQNTDTVQAGEAVSGSVKAQSLWSRVRTILLWPLSILTNILRK